MLDELILHIGTHKTGTTSIQNACAAHAGQLAKSGITYPRRHLDETGHHEIYWGLSASPKRHKTLSLSKIATNYIEEATKNGTNKLLISNEALWSLDPNQINKLTNLFPAKRYKIVLYVRRQDKYLISAFKQGIKSFNRRLSLEIFEFYLKTGFFERSNYLDLISKWRHTLDNIEVDVHVYEAATKHPKGLVGHFHENLEVKFDFISSIFSRRQTRSNVSLCAICTLALAEINRLGDINESTHRKLITALSALDDNSAPKNRSLLSLGERREMTKYYHKSNRDLLLELGKSQDMAAWRWNEDEEAATSKATDDEVRVIIKTLARSFPELNLNET